MSPDPQSRKPSEFEHSDTAATEARANQSNLDRFAALIPGEMMDVPGHAFYTGEYGFSGNRPLYVLGLNPGGQNPETVRQQYASVRSGEPDYSAYEVHTWKAESRIDRNVLHLLRNLSLDAGQVPASCVLFARSQSESEIQSEFQRLASLCWTFHQSVIDTLGVKVVVCFGGLAANFVRKQLSANELVDQFVEQNNRGWKSATYVGEAGIRVVHVSHPSRADWRNPAADVSSLVKRALEASAHGTAESGDHSGDSDEGTSDRDDATPTKPRGFHHRLYPYMDHLVQYSNEQTDYRSDPNAAPWIVRDRSTALRNERTGRGRALVRTWTPTDWEYVDDPKDAE